MFGFYKGFLSPAIHSLGGGAMGCRYPQTCSEYSYNSIVRSGFIKGMYLSLKRILSCNPWMTPNTNMMFADESTSDKAPKIHLQTSQPQLINNIKMRTALK